MVTIGFVRASPPVDPKKPASPKANSPERTRREPRIVIPDKLRVALGGEKRSSAGSTLLPRFAVERGAPPRFEVGPVVGAGPAQSNPSGRRLGRTYVGSRRERER